jgi:hypothetical protein
VVVGVTLDVDPFSLTGDEARVRLEESNQISLFLTIFEGTVWIIAVENDPAVVTV